MLELDTLKYLSLASHLSGPTNLWNTDLWKSFNRYTTGPIYNPIYYSQKIGPALVFYKNMLLRRQRVLLISSIESKLQLEGPFSHVFLTCAWIGGTLTNYRKVGQKIRYFGVLTDVLHYLESTFFNSILAKGGHITFINKNVNIVYKEVLFIPIFILPDFLEEITTAVELNITPEINKNLFSEIYLKSYNIFLQILYFAEKEIIKMPIFLFLSNYFYNLSYRMHARLSKQTVGNNQITLNSYYINSYPIINYNYYIYLRPFYYLKTRWLKEHSLMKFIKIWYKKPGPALLQLKRVFPAINIALDLRLANMYILNESTRLCLPIISFHKSTDPARGPVYTIPAHIATAKQVNSYGGYFLGLILKQQVMDIKQLRLWSNILSWRN